LAADVGDKRQATLSGDRWQTTGRAAGIVQYDFFRLTEAPGCRTRVSTFQTNILLMRWRRKVVAYYSFACGKGGVSLLAVAEDRAPRKSCSQNSRTVKTGLG